MRGLLICLLLLTGSGVFAQSGKVSIKDFNADSLNFYVLQEVNKLRKRKRLDSLVQDDVLEKAAKDQAQYMAKEQEIGHGQKSKVKGDPYSRVVYYGGAHNGVGENVQSYDLEYAIKKSKNRLTYERLARDMVKVWEKSRPHYENLITPAFTNVAHAFELRDGQIFACEVFGTKPFVEKYEFSEGPELLTKKGNECFNCKQVQKKIYRDEVSLGWYTVSNDSIYYWNVTHYRKGRFYQKKKGKYLINFKRNNLNQIFSANGILTIDLLHYDQFDCNGKPSFHNSPYHNGYYLAALDKNTILTQDLHESPDLVQVFVGMKPAFKDTFFQVDFHLMKKKRNCIETSTIYVNPDFFKPIEYFKIPKPEVTLDKNLIITDSAVIKIPFERNQTNQDTSIFRPLITAMDSLVNDNHVIENIYFTGVASIEGTERDNRKLFMRRGAIIEEYLKRYYPELPFESSFYENFDDFRSGILAAGYVDATEISNDTLRMFANDFKDDKEIAQVLDQSRFSTVKITFKDYYPIQAGSYGLSVHRIKDLIAANELNEIVPLYLVMANKALEGDTVLRDSLLTLKFPENKTYAKLHWYHFLLDQAANETEVTAQKLKKLYELEAIPNSTKYLEYRLTFNLFQQNEAIPVDDFEEVVKGIKSKREKAWVESLHLINEVENRRMSSEIAVTTLMENVLKMKFDMEKTYFISQYLIRWGYTAEPYVLLSKFARRSGEISKLYKQYLKLGYYLQQFESEREWKKIRNVVKALAENDPKAFCSLFQWDEMGVSSLEKKEIATLFCEHCHDEQSASAEK